MKLKAMHVNVTGGASGIGRVTALLGLEIGYGTAQVMIRVIAGEKSRAFARR